MKVEKVKKEFEPIQITIQDSLELKILKNLIENGRHRLANSGIPFGLICNFADELLNELNK